MAKKKSTLSQKDYERLGRLLVSVSETGGADKHAIYRLAFIKGMLGGLGGVIGATLLLGALLFVLSLFGNVPLLGDVTETIRNSIQSSE